MSIRLGNGVFTANITSERITGIVWGNSPPEISLWEKIKDFFFSTHQEEALTYIYQLSHPKSSLTKRDLETMFNRLSVLASPGYKACFRIEENCAQNQTTFHITDQQGKDIFIMHHNPVMSDAWELDI